MKKLNSNLLDLRNLDVKIDYEDVALIILVSLPSSYENFVESFVVGKDSLTLEEVKATLHTRKFRQKAIGDNGEEILNFVSIVCLGRHTSQSLARVFTLLMMCSIISIQIAGDHLG